MAFHLQCSAKYSDESQKIAIFLYLDSLPINIEKVRVEFDLLCESDTKHTYRNFMEPQWLWKNKQYCGFQTFPSSRLSKYKFIKWRLGIKIIQIKYVQRRKSIALYTLPKPQPNIQIHTSTELNKEKFDINNIEKALEINDTQSIINTFNFLIEQTNYNTQKYNH